MRIFISYTNKEKEFANNLARVLVENNIYIWKDDYQMQRGANITSEIIKGINKCTNMIIIFSREYIRKISKNHSYCKVEFEKAMEMQQKDDNFIIPVIIEDCNIPYNIKDRLFVDFRNSYNDGIEQLNEIVFKYLKSGSILENNPYIIDYAKYWGIKYFEVDNNFTERFELNIDSVSFESGESYSILCQYMIIGDEEFTNIYKRFLQLGNDKILIKKIIKKFYEELEPSTKKACIMLDTDGFKEIKSQIDIGRYAFQYKIYINRLGSVPNRVAEFNYGSIIEVVYNAINNN